MRFNVFFNFEGYYFQRNFRSIFLTIKYMQINGF
jgi:hypothetical protein